MTLDEIKKIANDMGVAGEQLPDADDKNQPDNVAEIEEVEYGDR